jgi:hypothetical protein
MSVEVEEFGIRTAGHAHLGPRADLVAQCVIALKVDGLDKAYGAFPGNDVSAGAERGDTDVVLAAAGLRRIRQVGCSERNVHDSSPK